MSVDDLPPDDTDHTSFTTRPCVVHTVTETGDRATVFVHGDMDMTAAPAVREAVDRVVDTGTLDLRIDLGGVPFIDSSGLGSLVYAYRLMKDRGGDVTLWGVGPQPARVLRITHLDRIIRVVVAEPTPHVHRS